MVMMMMMVSTKASRSQAAMLAAATTVNALFSEDSLPLNYNEILPPSLLKTILLIKHTSSSRSTATMGFWGFGVLGF